MNKTEKTAFRESVIVVMMGMVINFPLQTFLLWLTIDNWSWTNTLLISIFHPNYSHSCGFDQSLFNTHEVYAGQVLRVF